MKVAARTATSDDIPTLARLYEELASEMSALSPLWRPASGLRGEPSAAMAELLDDEDTEVCLASIDRVPVGFAVVTSEPLPASDERMARIRYIFTEQPAREVGAAAALLAHVIEVMEERGHSLFDADVLPGHRLAKNFFEAAGFKARHIVMHRK